MYYLSKRIEIAFAHQLQLDYESPCRRQHGHNAIVTVYCRAEELNANGMVVDFKHVKEIVKERLDHRCLNDLFDFNPTAENIARWICDQIPQCYKVTVQESEGNIAAYVKDLCADDEGL
ncbi:MAG: 6-carboxytetrahydropterin synthase [Alloprevotella sp.]|nr:6-carboxytetrahydropterin synthase [Alloprevotella sp.]